MSALLALQRAAGNSAVSKLLSDHGQSALNMGLLRATVQRRKPSAGHLAGEAKSRVEALETRVKRLENQQKANSHLNGFRDQVMARCTAWERAIINLGTAYATAAKLHTDAVEKKKRVDAIKSQVMFSVLTVASAGTAAWISNGIQAGKEASILINVLEDTVQASIGEAFSAVGPGIDQRAPTPSQTTVSIEPQVFQGQRLARLKQAEESAYNYFKEMNDALLKTKPEEWESYDEAKQLAEYDAWFKKADLIAAGNKFPSVDEMARELERGFWAKWAPALKQMRLQGRTDKEYAEYASPGFAVEERWDILGITKESGVGDFGWWTSDEEIEKVLNWAKGHKVKEFVPDKP